MFGNYILRFFNLVLPGGIIIIGPSVNFQNFIQYYSILFYFLVLGFYWKINVIEHRYLVWYIYVFLFAKTSTPEDMSWSSDNIKESD